LWWKYPTLPHWSAEPVGPGTKAERACHNPSKSRVTSRTPTSTHQYIQNNFDDRGQTQVCGGTD
jgi:hypothetical protein